METYAKSDRSAASGSIRVEAKALRMIRKSNPNETNSSYAEWLNNHQMNIMIIATVPSMPSMHRGIQLRC